MKNTTIIRQINKALKALAFVAIAAMFVAGTAEAGKGLEYGGYDYNYYSPSYSSGSSGLEYGGYDYNYYSPSYSTPSYQYSNGGGSYVPAPAQRYVYNTPTGGGSAGGSQLSYVYSSNSNKNSNANSNTNNINNTFNPTNNNDINIVVLGGGTGTTETAKPALDGYCVISPSIAYVNQDVSFSATASGGSSGYTYRWSGDNGINATSQSFTGRFSYAGTKTATVVITSGSQSITRTCNVTIQQDTYIPPVTGAYCVATPSNPAINQPVTWTAYVNGSAYGASTFSWSGTDGLYGNGPSVSRAYSTPGYKTATFTAYVNGQTVSGTCSVNINGVIASNVTVIRDQNLGTPVSGVFLSQVPATGISFGLKMTLFTAGIILWSLFAAYVLTKKSKGLATATAGTSSSIESAAAAVMTKAQAFKLSNMQKKGLAQ